MKKRNFLFFIFCAALGILIALPTIYTNKDTAKASTSPYTVTLFSSDNGVTTGEANAVLQTSDGFIWVGGYGGLQRYDGKNFVSFGTKDGMTSNAIRALFESSDNTLWIGTNDKGLYCYKCGTFRQVEWIDGLNRVVRCIAEDEKGRIWFGTSYSGVAYLDEYGIHNFSLDYLENNYDTTISTLSYQNGLLWGSSYDGSIFAIDTNNMVVTARFAVGDLWADDDAYSVLAASDGKIYVGLNAHKIAILEQSGTTYNASIIATTNLNSINAICETSGGEIWFCGKTGIGRIYNGTYEDLSYIDYTESLVNITEDYEHNIWVASSGFGALHIEREKVSRVINTPKLLNAETHSICKVGDKWFVGASTGLFAFDSNWDCIYNMATAEFLDKNIRDLYYDGTLLYIAADYNGFYTYNPAIDTTPEQDVTNTYTGNQFRTIIDLSDGSLAIGTNKGLNILKNNSVTFSTNIGISVLCMLELSDGTLLVGTDGNGIYSYKDNVFNEYANTNNNLSGGVILRMIEDTTNAGQIFVSCGNDVFYGNRDNFLETAELKNGSGSVVDMFLDGDNIWLFKQSGIIRCLRSEFIDSTSTMPSQFYIYKEDGVPGNVVANSWNKFIDNEFILCTTNGIGILDTQNIYKNQEKPKVSILSIVDSNGNIWDGSEQVILTKDITKIALSFAALSYDRCTVEYWLEGFDGKSIVKNISDVNEVEYTNLKKGTYKFHLKVYNADGVSSEEVIINIIKEPKFNETGWFYVVIVMGVILVAGFVAGLLILQSKRKQKFYKKVTDESIATISGVIDAKDPYTNGHSLRVAEFAVKIAKRMGLSKEDCERLNYIALLHDIGKIGVPDCILNKPGRLTDEEFKEIKHHVEVGGEVLSNFTVLKGVTEGALYHHERFDGSGYCKGLKGEEIPLFARIIAVADSYDAMNSSRCYRPAMEKSRIIEELTKGKDAQFDGRIADVAIQIIKDEEKSK